MGPRRAATHHDELILLAARLVGVGHSHRPHGGSDRLVLVRRGRALRLGEPEVVLPELPAESRSEAGGLVRLTIHGRVDHLGILDDNGDLLNMAEGQRGGSKPSEEAGAPSHGLPAASAR